MFRRLFIKQRHTNNNFPRHGICTVNNISCLSIQIFCQNLRKPKNLVISNVFVLTKSGRRYMFAKNQTVTFAYLMSSIFIQKNKKNLMSQFWEISIMDGWLKRWTHGQRELRLVWYSKMYSRVKEQVFTWCRGKGWYPQNYLNGHIKAY